MTHNMSLIQEIAKQKNATVYYSAASKAYIVKVCCGTKSFNSLCEVLQWLIIKK